MSHPVSDRPGERVFTAKSQWHLYLPFMIGGLIAGAVALELGLGTRLRSEFHVGPSAARDVARMLGAAAALVFLIGAGAWYCSLRWVAVSADGIRWWRNGGVHGRGWDDFAGVQRIVYEFQQEDGKVTGRKAGAAVRFHAGSPLVVSPDLLSDYEELLDALEAGPRGRQADLLFGRLSG